MGQRPSTSKHIHIRDDINNFRQVPSEPLNYTWVIFKRKLVQCLNDKLPDKMLLKTFMYQWMQLISL